MIEDWIGLIDLLPEPWRPYALLVLEVMLLAAGAAPLLKWSLRRTVGDPQPGQDSRGKSALYGLAMALDWLAANSTPVREKIRQARASMPPPRHSMPPEGGR